MAKKFQIVTRSAPFLLEPEPFAELASEILYGETVETISHHGDYLKAKCLTDGYEGYIEKSALSDDLVDFTHKVIKLHSFIYNEPDYKSRSVTYLSFLSRLSVTGDEENGFAEIEGGGWIWTDDIAPKDYKIQDYTKAAEMFIGIPYVWGGRTSRGLDCSGLVQLSLLHAGIACPRDSGDQHKQIKGEHIELTNAYAPDGLKRGDLVFFKGHVGIMTSPSHILNATARTLDIRTEELADMSRHYDEGILAIKRLA
jgi:cell wall-associated NlpC family hydrolase